MLVEQATVTYRITPEKEPVPRVGDQLHACGLTNWHLVVLEVERVLPPNQDGTVDTVLCVRRSVIEKANPCPICGVLWKTPQGTHT